MSDYDHLEPLSEIAQMEWCDASEVQLNEWSRKYKVNGFPEPKERVARYKFYDPEEVRKWFILYRKATKRMGRGEQLNGTRTDS